MSWYYASGGQQMGPVDDAALDDLVRQGVVRDDTLVWRQGLAGWQPHGTARPRPAAPVAAPAPAAWPAAQPAAAAPATQAAAPAQEMRFCSNCGRSIPVSQLTTVSGASVCAACLPLLSGGSGGASAAAAPQPGPYQQQAPPQQQQGYAPPPSYPAPGGYAPAGYPPAGMVGQTRYGGFWIRFLARIIDGIITGIVSTIIRIPLALMMGGVGVGLGGLGNNDNPAAALAALPALFGLIGLSILISFVINFVYEVYFLSTKGATPGKMALGLKVIKADGSPLTTGAAVGRYFAYILSTLTLTIGFIIAGFDEQKRSLHDRLCDTRVVKV